MFLLGALLFSKIKIVIKMFYYLLGLNAAKEKLKIVIHAAPPRSEKLPKNL